MSKVLYVLAIVSIATLALTLIVFDPLNLRALGPTAAQTVSEEKATPKATPSPSEDSPEEEIVEVEEVEPTIPPEVIEEEVAPDNASAAKELHDYLASTERSDKFVAFATKAGPKLVDAMQFGHFGNIAVSYPAGEGVAGWGSIATTDESADHSSVVVRVWMNEDGSTNTDELITNLGLYYEAEGKFTSISIHGVDNGTLDYWTAFLKADGVTTTNSDAVSYVEQLGWEGLTPSPLTPTEMPTSIEEFKEFDDEVFRQLEAAMASWNLVVE